MGQHIYQALFLNHGSISMRHPATDCVRGHTGLSMAEREGVGLQGCASLTLGMPGKDWAPPWRAQVWILTTNLHTKVYSEGTM